MNVEEAKEIIRRWAATKSQVKRVWIFGSRVRGDNGDDSDLDVALEFSLPQNEAMSEWICNGSALEEELNRVLPCEVDLEWFDPNDPTSTPTILSGLQESSVLVYETGAAG